MSFFSGVSARSPRCAGRLKLVKQGNDPPMLFNLALDIGEKATCRPETGQDQGTETALKN